MVKNSGNGNAPSDPPKRKLSGYMTFCKERRQDFVKENPTAKMTDIAKLMGASWRQMDTEEKEGWNKKANE